MNPNKYMFCSEWVYRLMLTPEQRMFLEIEDRLNKKNQNLTNPNGKSH